MDFLSAIILGLVQGLTEFIPVSSSAHVRVVGAFLGTGEDPGAAFTAITQLGTETAVVIYFWKDIVTIIKNWALALVGKIPRNDPHARMGWLVILGSIPIVVLGLAFQDQIETTLRSLWVVAIMLIGFGLLLGFADWIGRKARSLERLSWGHGLIYGCAQALALIPGVSRSGGTITAGLLMGYKREAAARYSFLLAIPAVFGSGIYQAVKAIGGFCTGGTTGCGAEVFGPVETIVATVVAFLVALVVIAFFMRYISKHSFWPFVFYRILIGVVLIVLLTTGVLPS